MAEASGGVQFKESKAPHLGQTAPHSDATAAQWEQRQFVTCPARAALERQDCAVSASSWPSEIVAIKVQTRAEEKSSANGASTLCASPHRCSTTSCSASSTRLSRLLGLSLASPIRRLARASRSSSGFIAAYASARSRCGAWLHAASITSCAFQLRPCSVKWREAM